MSTWHLKTFFEHFFLCLESTVGSKIKCCKFLRILQITFILHIFKKAFSNYKILNLVKWKSDWRLGNTVQHFLLPVLDQAVLKHEDTSGFVLLNQENRIIFFFVFLIKWSVISLISVTLQRLTANREI